MLMEYYNLCEYPNSGPCGRALLWPLDVIGEDVRFYRQDGLDGLGAFTGFDQLCFPSPFRLWAWLRLWNEPDVSLRTLEDDFYGNYFGENAGVILRHAKELERLMREPASEENLARLEALPPTLADARGERVEAVRLHFRYALLLKRLFFAWQRDDRSGWESLKTAYLAFQDENREELSKLLAPFPILWYSNLFGAIGWDKAGRKISLRPGTGGMIK